MKRHAALIVTSAAIGFMCIADVSARGGRGGGGGGRGGGGASRSAPSRSAPSRSPSMSRPAPRPSPKRLRSSSPPGRSSSKGFRRAFSVRWRWTSPKITPSSPRCTRRRSSGFATSTISTNTEARRCWASTAYALSAMAPAGSGASRTQSASLVSSPVLTSTST